ncbi:MAG: hypothetical protein KW788_04210 [Candidatus Doudnabacteria bacterium]|nr:hypothetical protein [Candidatus Doudnabacteria bacterium]
MFGLNSQIEGLGGEYVSLNELSASEKSLIDTAKKELADAQAELEEAQGKWSMFGIRARAVARANARIVAATPRVAENEAEAKKRQRARLLKADMASSLQEIQLRASKTVQIMKRRYEDIKKQLAAVGAEKIRLLDTVRKSAQTVEKFDAAIATKEAETKQAEDKLSTLENGTDEHAAQNKKVSGLKAELEELIGGRNVALVSHQESDKFAKALEVDERTHIRLRDNLLMWITALEKDTEARVVTFKSRLEAMKASADQDIAKQIDTLGAAADKANVTSMAAMGAASDRARVERFKQMPQRIRDIMDIAKLQIEARGKIEAEMHDLIEEWRNQYGIDPLATSFFTDADRAHEEDSTKSN